MVSLLSPIVNLPNRVRDKQISIQNEKGPTYLRGNGKYYYRAYLVLFATSLAVSQYHLIQFVRGKAKKNGE